MNIKILDSNKWISNGNEIRGKSSSTPNVVTVGGNDNSCMTWDII
jgi:hypothetical protein